MKVYVKIGNIVRNKTMPASEVMMHMGIVGQQFDVLIKPGAWGAAAQLLRPDGSAKSAAVLMGEAGFYQDSAGERIYGPGMSYYFNTEQNPEAYVESRGLQKPVKTEQSYEAITGSLMDTFGPAWDALSVDEKVALAEDVYAMARDEDLLSVDAVKEFVRRIGGTQNFAGYVRTLMAKPGRRESRAFENKRRTPAQQIRGFMEAHAKAQARQQGYKIEYLSAGTRVLVTPTGEGSKSSYPAANWITGPTKVTLLEDAPNEGTLDVLDVRLDDGREESIYDFNIESVVSESLKHEGYSEWVRAMVGVGVRLDDAEQVAGGLPSPSDDLGYFASEVRYNLTELGYPDDVASRAASEVVETTYGDVPSWMGDSLRHEEFEVGDKAKFQGEPVEVVQVGVEGGSKVRVRFKDGTVGNVFPDALT